MIKSFAALAIFAFLCASVIALPGFVPSVKADEAVALTKADRLPIHSAAGACASQVWPNLDASCLHSTEPGSQVGQARLVTARR
jgi:hypothetical protein